MDRLFNRSDHGANSNTFVCDMGTTSMNDCDDGDGGHGHNVGQTDDYDCAIDDSDHDDLTS